ncbi:hypothetical protein L484_009906 [Morus notabilis]|uniref:Uncharacterized protein n=1 Tax=Morus notabilis TaxID=981085 RepID=W9S208_9ROSA|nr:uncharacterized protein LOC21393221 isoform X2 [Morus notabilis]EXC04713.1 hypothetical protein L484_009906 [Morus notabilis]
MAVSLNSVLGFTSTLRIKYQNVSKPSSGASISKACQVKSSFGASGSRRLVKGKRWDFSLSVAEGDRFTAETSDGGSGNAERLLSNDQISTSNLPSSLYSIENSQVQTSPRNESLPQTSEASNGSPISPNQGETLPSTDQQEKPKRSPLTVRERLRAARVLSRYNTESKASKPDMGSKVLDALRESDRGKKKGLPEAPGNMFDDSKRGLPQQGFTFQFPGGNDLFIIVFSFVFISTVMFATTYIVWKVGAIHFNEY